MTPATMITFDGITQPVTEWALDYGIAPAVIVARLERGLSVEQAITTPMVTARGQKLTGKHLDRYIRSQRFAWQCDRRKRAPRTTQPSRHRPRRPTQRYAFDGRTMTLWEWSKELGISASTLEKRVRAGWPIERVLMPTDGRKDRKRPGVVSNFETLRGTGAGSFPQEIPEITFSEQAENA